MSFLNNEYIPLSARIDNNLPFYISISRAFMNCEKIYPIQQKKIRTILDSLINKDNINKIIVFGSSTSYKCHVGSDVDLYIDLIEKKESINKDNINFELDLWDNFTVDNHLLNEIEKTGVVIYER